MTNRRTRRARQAGAGAALVAMLAAGARARAEEPTFFPVPPPQPVPVQPLAAGGPRPLPEERPSLIAKQLGLGVAGLLATGLLGLSTGFVDPDWVQGGALGALWLAPGIVGTIVCQVGHGSLVYDGRCLPTIGGAYIGALALVPGALLGGLATCTGSSSDWSDPSAPSGTSSGSDSLGDCFTGVIVGGALGYTIGTLTGAMIGWNRSRRPRS